MNSSQKNRTRLSIEALEHRDVPATLTISPPGWINPDTDPIVKEMTASAKPGWRRPRSTAAGWCSGRCKAPAPGRSNRTD